MARKNQSNCFQTASNRIFLNSRKPIEEVHPVNKNNQTLTCMASSLSRRHLGCSIMSSLKAELPYVMPMSTKRSLSRTFLFRLAAQKVEARKAVTESLIRKVLEIFQTAKMRHHFIKVCSLRCMVGHLLN